MSHPGISRQPDESTAEFPLGMGAAGLALLFWAFPSVIAKALPIDAIPLVLFRGWLGVVWAIAVLYLRGRRLTLRALRVSLWGGIALGVDLICFFSAIKLTTIANTMVIGALQPVLLIFAAPFFFNERVRLPDIGAAFVAMGGVALVIFGSGESASWNPRGELFAFVMLFAWTAYLIASKKARESIGSTEFAASVTLIATLMVTPLVLLPSVNLTAPEPRHWLGLGAIAILGWCGHVLMNWSLGHIPLWLGGIAALAIPVLSSALAALFLGELLVPIQILGMAIVVSSLTVVTLLSPRLKAEEMPS